MNKVESIRKYIENYWTATEIMSAWREYCDRHNYSEYYIYNMRDIDDLFGNMTISEFLNICDDDLSKDDEFIYFSPSTGYLCSLSDFSDIPFFDFDELAEFVADSNYIDVISKDYLINDLLDDASEDCEGIIRGMIEDGEVDVFEDDWEEIYKRAESDKEEE